MHDREQKSVSQIILKTFQQKHSFNPLMGQVLSLKEECCASLALTKSSRFDFYILYLILQAPAYEEDGETIGMTTNSDVSSHKPTKESPIFKITPPLLFSESNSKWSNRAGKKCPRMPV